jgi:8-hydroxy-5-deazaflavin:NADPH oxidoreductase
MFGAIGAIQRIWNERVGVVLLNSRRNSANRNPRCRARRPRGIGAEAASVTEAAAADLVLLAVPWPAVPDTLDPLPDWRGRILVDATNPFITINPLELADLQGRSASVIVAEHAPGARVVKGFNTITMANFEKGPRQGEARRVLFVSGDDVASKQTVEQLITELGYAAIDLGGLDEGGRMQQPGGPLAGRDLLVNQ